MVGLSDAYTTFLEEFGEFTEIQKLSVPIIERGSNCIITAPPGSGKTEAALLPVLSRIQKEGNSAVAALYITPLRALNRDLFKRLKALCDKLGITIDVRHGDTPIAQRARQSKNPPQIIITTPESVQSLLMTKTLYKSLKNLRAVVVDELHELYYNKRGAQLAVALERLVEVSGEFQRIGVSATIGDINSAAYFLCASRACDIVEARQKKSFEIEIAMPKAPKREYAQFSEKFGLDRQALARIEYMADQISRSKATLLFANTRQVVESLGSKLLYFEKEAGFGGIGVHHSSLDKEERIATENAFKEGRIRSIIATSSLELGIDIGAVDLVIQYGSPRQVTRLVQRIGRSGHREKQSSNGKIVVASALDAIESAAIVALNKTGNLERRELQENALDVLINQLSAVALEYGEFDSDFFFRLIRRSSGYANLSREAFGALVAFAREQKLVRTDGDRISVGGRARRYAIEKISVIPDATRFTVKNVSSNRIIANLDENFVYNNIEEGTTFVTKGLVWRAISIEEQTIFVEPSVEIDAAVPDWEGEDIPVSYAVAQRAFGFLSKQRLSEFKQLVEGNAYSSIAGLIEEQDKTFQINDETLYIEEMDDRAIIYSALGKLGNELFAKIVSSIASVNTGRRIFTRATPYAVIIEYEGMSKVPDIMKIIATFKGYELEKLLQSAEFVMSFDMFRYRFIQVAKLFGVVEKKATITRSVATRLMEFYRDSPIFEETMRDLGRNYFDVESVRRLQHALKERTIKPAIFRSYGSAISGEILKSAYFYRELMNPLLPNSAEVEQFEEGILRKSAELICTYCGFRFAKKLSEIKEHERIKCPSCKSPMVAVYSEGYEKVIEKRKNDHRMTKGEREVYAEALGNASLVEAYGLRALIALATYGVGAKTAARVLRMLRKDVRHFLIDLINAQKQFVKTKKYWAGR